MEYFIQLLKTMMNNKGKFVLMLMSFTIFLFLLFPNDDLSDLITSQVSQLSNNSVFLQFEKLKMSLFPTPGVKLDRVYLESVNTPAFSAQELSITPSLSGIIQKKAYGHVDAKGFLKGNVSLDVEKGSKSDNGLERNRIEVTAKSISLHDLREFANLPVLLKGQLNFQGIALTDLALQEQPDIDIDLSVQKFELPPSNIETQMGPISLPELKLTTIALKGRLAAGKFILENGAIGKQDDDLYGSLKGNIELKIINGPNGFSHQIGAYNLEVDLKAKRKFQENAGLFLSFIDAYKTPSPEGAQYKFKISRANPMMNPSFSAIR